MAGRSHVLRIIATTWDRHGEPPVYASRQFDELDPDDPRWVASIMRAAEAWHRHHDHDEIGQRLDEEDMAVARRLREASWDMSALPRSRTWTTTQPPTPGHDAT